MLLDGSDEERAALTTTGAEGAIMTAEALAEGLYTRVQSDLGARPHTPLSTYRVQLHQGFTFEQARAVVPYLARLGVSDL